MKKGNQLFEKLVIISLVSFYHKPVKGLPGQHPSTMGSAKVHGAQASAPAMQTCARRFLTRNISSTCWHLAVIKTWLRETLFMEDCPRDVLVNAPGITWSVIRLTHRFGDLQTKVPSACPVTELLWWPCALEFCHCNSNTPRIVFLKQLYEVPHYSIYRKEVVKAAIYYTKQCLLYESSFRNTSMVFFPGMFVLLDLWLRSALRTADADAVRYYASLTAKRATKRCWAKVYQATCLTPDLTIFV